MPTRAASDTVHETVEQFKVAWHNHSEGFGLPDGHAGKLAAHFETLPLWRMG